MRIISLGAGVQSSTLALMCALGEIEAVQHAIFADTQAEPAEVYDWLDYLEAEIAKCPHPFPVHRVTAGNLETDFLAALANPKKTCGQPPFMVFNHEKTMGSRLWRKCTAEYKLNPIRRKVRELRGKAHVEQLIGISRDEAHRMKPSGVKYITNCYPLVDAGITRTDCLRWMEKHGYQKPPKSACYFCPYMDNARLRDMRDNKPGEWQRLVQFDHKIRAEQRETINSARITGTLYVHRDCKPIEEIDLRTAADFGQADLFGEDCSGMCGV